ncbi:thioesterase family protein [Microbispora sp. NPDC049633]|uniref:acyl-CoA thioesterase n=1 Tax=Microbispora sp. NPDC049633 TaxID=3154355 RepID=UPI003445F872
MDEVYGQDQRLRGLLEAWQTGYVLVIAGTPRISAVATFAPSSAFDADDERAATWHPMPAVPPPAECVPLPLHRLTGTFEQRLDRRAPTAETVGFLTDGPAGPPEIGGWTRFSDGTPTGVTTVPLLMDSWPPPPHRHFGLGGSVVTVDLTVHWRGRPGNGWHFVWFDSRFLRHGYVEIDGRLWRADGVLVAQSRQLARYTPPPI